MKSFSFRVAGDPKTKGSNVSFVSKKTGRVVTKDGCKGLRGWLEAVGWAAREVYKGPPTNSGVVLHLHFMIYRPTSHFKTKHRGELHDEARAVHLVKPDVDKLARAVLDALTDVVYVDDSQVVHLSAQKTYVDVRPGLQAKVTIGGE